MKAEHAGQRSLALNYGLLMVAWSALMGGSLLWSLYQESHNTLALADAAARANINKDLAFRRWATSHGGVYVAPSEHTPPNPYLQVSDRDVVTSSGKQLTLMNPAYMLRELQNDFPDEYGSKSHITSLKPLNPNNAPDGWETDALHAFARGEEERVERQQIEGQPYLRLMRPFVVEPGCLKCHGFQDYKVGDIRGGLCTSIALAPFIGQERKHQAGMILSHGVIWLVGLAGLGVSLRRDRRVSDESRRRQRAAMTELAREEEKFHTVADFTFNWEYWEGPQHEILYMSPSCERVTGYSAAEFSADPELLLRIVHPDDRHLMESHRRDREHIDDAVLDFRIVTRDGEIRWIAHGCRSVFGRDGSFRGLRVSNRDITERKQAEAEILQLNQELDQRVKERTARLESVIKELEGFAYTIAHDLRAPLRHLDGYVNMLVSCCRDDLGEQGLHCVDTIASSAQRMGMLIDDLLQFSRTGRIEMRREQVNMNQTVQAVLAQFKESCAARTIEWHIGDLPSVQGDPILLHQVWANLLGNAVKYTRTRKAIRIKVSAREENGETGFFVSDNGVGFDMRYADKLFGVFQRLHSLEEFEGTGIGLATVHRIITRHGGRIWAEAEVDKGATFYFTLSRTAGEGHRHEERFHDELSRRTP